MKKRIAIPIIAILAILVVVLGVLQVTTLRRFARGTAEPDGTMSPDAVSSASMLLQSGSFDYTLENATDAFSLPNTAVVISTVNADGTPNAASMQTMVIDHETIAVTSSLGNQTMINISERNYAIFTIYSVQTDESMGNGARLVVERMSDEDRKAKEKETGQSLRDNLLVMKVVRVMPLA